MTDFGRRDFGKALKHFFEADDTIGDFKASADAQQAGTAKDQAATAKTILTMLDKFEAKFNKVRQNLNDIVEETNAAFAEYQKSVEGRALSTGPVSDDEARAAVLGKLRKGKASAIAGAPEVGKGNPDTGLLQQASRKQLLSGDPAVKNASKAAGFPNAGRELGMVNDPTSPATARASLPVAQDAAKAARRKKKEAGL